MKYSELTTEEKTMLVDAAKMILDRWEDETGQNGDPSYSAEVEDTKDIIGTSDACKTVGKNLTMPEITSDDLSYVTDRFKDGMVETLTKHHDKFYCEKVLLSSNGKRDKLIAIMERCWEKIEGDTKEGKLPKSEMITAMQNEVNERYGKIMGDYCISADLCISEYWNGFVKDFSKSWLEKRRENEKLYHREREQFTKGLIEDAVNMIVKMKNQYRELDLRAEDTIRKKPFILPWFFPSGNGYC